MAENPESLRRSVVLIVTAIVIIVLAFALWEFVVRNLSSIDDTEYKIEFWSGSESIGKVGMSELDTLPTTSYVDTLGSGTTDEGPWLKDVILLIFDEASLTNSTEITLTSDLTGEERTVTWG
ncbi:MAG: hypothetical protein V3U09_07845, partial [Thermoplasmata archaeon]